MNAHNKGKVIIKLMEFNRITHFYDKPSITMESESAYPTDENLSICLFLDTKQSEKTMGFYAKK